MYVNELGLNKLIRAEEKQYIASHSTQNYLDYTSCIQQFLNFKDKIINIILTEGKKKAKRKEKGSKSTLYSL